MNFSKKLYTLTFLMCLMFGNAQALMQTGILTLDSANTVCEATSLSLLQGNKIQLQFRKPLQLSFIKVMYESLHCVRQLCLNTSRNMYVTTQAAILELTDEAYRTTQKSVEQDSAATAAPAMYAFNF